MHHEIGMAYWQAKRLGFDLNLAVLPSIRIEINAWLASTPYRFRGAFDEATFRVAVRIGLIELLRSA
jgi:hypothetical protein